MADLKKEYTDIKNVKHKVEHITSDNVKDNKEQIAKALCDVLVKQKRLST